MYERFLKNIIPELIQSQLSEWIWVRRYGYLLLEFHTFKTFFVKEGRTRTAISFSNKKTRNLCSKCIISLRYLDQLGLWNSVGSQRRGYILVSFQSSNCEVPISSCFTGQMAFRFKFLLWVDFTNLIHVIKSITWKGRATRINEDSRIRAIRFHTSVSIMGSKNRKRIHHFNWSNKSTDLQWCDGNV